MLADHIYESLQSWSRVSAGARAATSEVPRGFP